MLKPYTNIINIVCVFLLMTLAGCTTTSQTGDTAVQSQIDAPPEARAEFTRALQILKSGQHGVALPLFQKMAQRYPQFAGVHVNIGIIHLQNNKSSDAIAAFKRAIQLNPANASAHHHLGIIYRQTGQFNAAKQAYHQALKINPDYANAHLNLGILYDLYLQQQAQALEHYQQFKRLTTTEDKQVRNWIIDLERRVKASQAKTQGDS